MAKGPTPIRRQYLRIKQKYPEAIIFFRLGDFYETFDEDAEIVARELQIVLTSRTMGKGQRFPMAGIPHHALDGYLARLINAGYKVAICEQTGDPKASKGLVEREVVRVVTPGTVIESNLLDTDSNNYLAAIAVDGERAGIAYVDITTSEFAVTQVGMDRTQAELERLGPSEIIISESSDLPHITRPVTRLENRWFEVERARQILLEHFGVATLEGFGCADMPLSISAAGAVIHYLGETRKEALGQLSNLSTYSTESFMVLDAQTRRNLELFQSGQLGTVGNSLLSVIDLTRTPMGGRLIKQWLGRPLLDITGIAQRQEAALWFVENTTRRVEVINTLGRMADMERLVNRVRSGEVVPRELVSLRQGLEAVPQIKAVIEDESSPLGWLSSDLRPCREAVDLISKAINERASENGQLIKEGFSSDLDQIRSARKNARQYIADLERKERERTGIKSLKVGYNKVFGYYIEVTSANLSRIPEEYIRKQTLVGAERFFTPELKEYESLILNADERMNELENVLFKQVCQQVGGQGDRILMNARAIARIDVLAAFAEAAVRYSYIKPEVNEGACIKITGGRHPVVERVLEEEAFVPNDTFLSNPDWQIAIITGPNMAGKSTYLRQVALIVLMAHIGSFVPADSAEIGLVDRIFTRVGLMDDLATGRSTFMIEMTETANILNNATPKSLIILDEIGRGTSTYDGLSIAHAVVEYIHNTPRLGSKTLFATHYHELVDLANLLPRVKNCNVAVAEEGGRVVFLRKITPGGADRSYGIHVAQLAGLPKSVVKRAQEILDGLESDSRGEVERRERSQREQMTVQIPLFGAKPQVVEELERLDVDSMTPLEAITRLYELQKRANS